MSNILAEPKESRLTMCFRLLQRVFTSLFWLACWNLLGSDEYVLGWCSPWARYLVSIASLTWAYQGGIGRGKYYNVSPDNLCTWPVASLGKAKWLWRFSWYRTNRQQCFVSSGKRRFIYRCWYYHWYYHYYHGYLSWMLRDILLSNLVCIILY